MAAWLLALGAAPDARDEAGISPLMVAAEAGCAPLVGALLDAGAQLDGRSAAGCTPLHYAACAGAPHSPLCMLLLPRIRHACGSLHSIAGCISPETVLVLCPR
jgi:ankyrin repeat protein